jgi:hypothetical protein
MFLPNEDSPQETHPKRFTLEDSPPENSSPELPTENSPPEIHPENSSVKIYLIKFTFGNSTPKIRKKNENWPSKIQARKLTSTIIYPVKLNPQRFTPEKSPPEFHPQKF